MKRNKKGSVRDIFLIVILGFGLVLAGLLALKVMNTINTQFQANSDISTEAKTTLSTVNTRLPKWIDNAFIMFWVFMIIVGIFLAFQIQTNPVFIPISVLFFGFLIFISKVFSSIYNQLATSPTLSTQASSLTIIPYFIPRLPTFSFVFGLIIIIIMVAKR